MAALQVLQQDIGSLFFKHTANIFIPGPSGSGKTELVKKKCYKEWQSAYNILQERERFKIKFILGIPDDEDDIVTDVSVPH